MYIHRYDHIFNITHTLEKCLKHTETFENKHFKKKTLNVKMYKKRRTIQNEPLKTGCIQRKSVKMYKSRKLFTCTTKIKNINMYE